MKTSKEINEYLKRLKNGEGCLDELFNAVSGHIKFIAYRYLVDKSLVGDVVMNTFCRLLESLHLYDEQQSGKAWISKIAQNEAYTLNITEGRQAHESLDDLPDDVACASDLSESLQFDMDLQNALDKLDEQDRQIVELRILDDMTFQQIAEALDMHVGSVHKRCQRALKKIIKEIY